MLMCLLAFQSLVKYCKRDDPQVRKWAAEYEEASGTRIFEFVQDWRSQPSPPQQHLYPSHSQSQQKQPQTHALSNSFNAPHQLPHRRLSDVRNSNSQNFGLMNNSSSTRHQLAAETPSYSNPTNSVMKRSPSHSPPTSYSLGRPSNSNNSNSGSSRDARIQSSLNNVAGPSADRDTVGNESSLAQSQGQNNVGKFNNRDSNPGPSHLRWPPAGGGTGDGGIQSSYSSVASGGGSATSNDVSVASLGRLLGASTAAANSSTFNGTSGTSNQRNTALLNESYQSLPSLKASGLLDSWPGNSSARNAGESQKQNASATAQQPQSLSSQRASLSNLNLMLPGQSHHSTLQSDPADLRPPTLATMPVGLQWLANESR